MADEAQQPPSTPLGWQGLTADEKEKAFQVYVDLKDYFRLLRKETDRGCAMIVAAHLDQKLSQLLRGCMLQNKEYEDEITNLLKDPGPLGTFSARIRLAHYLNLISPQVRRDLDIIRKIRNDFAHELRFEDFNTPSIKDRCLNLQHDLLDSQSPRDRFVHTANVLIIFLDFFSKHGVGSFTLGGNPRSVEVAVMNDIADAFVSVIYG